MGMYAAQWRDYRRRHRAADAGLFGGPPVGVLLFFLIMRLIGGSWVLLLAIFSVGAVAWGWLAFRATRFPCPRCGQPFDSGRECGRCELIVRHVAWIAVQLQSPALRWRDLLARLPNGRRVPALSPGVMPNTALRHVLRASKQ